MPYRNIEFRAGCYYHLYNRGNNRQDIFLERENYLFFLRRVRKYFLEDAVQVVAYCLMPNHYHLLVYLVVDDLSAIMQRFALSYTKAFNKRYDRRGSLFEGPFGAKLVDTTEYLVHLSRYIHLNPVAGGFTSQAEQWEFSSYREYIGLRGGSLPCPDVVMAQFADRADYRAFVESYRECDVEVIRHLMLD